MMAPPKPRAWRLAEAAVGDLSIEQTSEGGYVLVVEYRDGHRLEQEITEAIRAAVAHEAQNSEVEAGLRSRIAELEGEVETAKDWIRKLIGQG